MNYLIRNLFFLVAMILSFNTFSSDTFDKEEHISGIQLKSGKNEDTRFYQGSFTRVIKAPNEQLKGFQRRLKVHLEKLYEPHQAATGFIKERGIVSNAKEHIKKAAVFNIDLANFFDQINFGRVRGMLMAKPYCLQEDTATIIAHLCCCNKIVPQGAPTSPVISNMICKKLDRELSFLAKKIGLFTLVMLMTLLFPLGP